MRNLRAHSALVFLMPIVQLLVLVGCGKPNGESGEELELTQDTVDAGIAVRVTDSNGELIRIDVDVSGREEPAEPTDSQDGEEPEWSLGLVAPDRTTFYYQYTVTEGTLWHEDTGDADPITGDLVVRPSLPYEGYAGGMDDPGPA
ncbi:MAG: hypothetical protein VCC04_11275, partial [Myxococcota bacterium]